jgi:gamma-glutamylcyclotransferase (GGCT)/AIG2-like uncharacterized protein YtfP
MKEVLFAVYGSLKKGSYNNYLLGNSEYLGVHKTEPSYSLYDGGFPVVERDGTTPITCEVYKATDQRIINSIFSLEGCASQVQGDPNNWYDFDMINTEHGNAVMFVMDKGQSGRTTLINSGVWGIQ